jgi:hypothetical protein
MKLSARIHFESHPSGTVLAAKQNELSGEIGFAAFTEKTLPILRLAGPLRRSRAKPNQAGSPRGPRDWLTKS